MPQAAEARGERRMRTGNNVAGQTWDWQIEKVVGTEKSYKWLDKPRQKDSTASSNFSLSTEHVLHFYSIIPTLIQKC